MQLNIVGLLFGDIFGEEEDSYDMEEYGLANFIVDDRESYRERSPMRYVLLMINPSKSLFLWKLLTK